MFADVNRLPSTNAPSNQNSGSNDGFGVFSNSFSRMVREHPVEAVVLITFAAGLTAATAATSLYLSGFIIENLK